MAWDFKLDPLTRDLVPGIVSGPEEIAQRLLTRLKRELGEWFLNVEAGLPWYQEGRGILGSALSTRRSVDLLVRREALNTEGVERVLSCRTVYAASSRSYGIYLEVFISGGGVMPLNLEITPGKEGGD